MPETWESNFVTETKFKDEQQFLNHLMLNDGNKAKCLMWAEKYQNFTGADWKKSHLQTNSSLRYIAVTWVYVNVLLYVLALFSSSNSWNS